MQEVAAPAWFRDALAHEADAHTARIDGCDIHYRTWGRRDRPGLLLVHGAGAHSHWWDFLAPQLSERYFVVAPDLSGHGESGRRDAYPRRGWAAELVALIDAVGLTQPPAIVGHSMGGLVTIVATALYPTRFAAAVVVDAPVRPPEPEEVRARRGQAFRNPKTYPDRETAIERFRLVPPQPCHNDFIVRHIATHSVCETDGGFTWKFDPRIFELVEREPMDEHLRHPGCPMALVLGADSKVVTPAIAAHMRGLMAPDAPHVVIPEAHHHVLLDRPLPFLDALRARLSAFGY